MVFSTHPRHVRGASLVPYSAMLDVPHEVVQDEKSSLIREGPSQAVYITDLRDRVIVASESRRLVAGPARTPCRTGPGCHSGRPPKKARIGTGKC